mgnify:CR=1 FL=1|tara:strand:- start:145 stop:897 length:753 start_codon:yes stop_codon:yes gene_type:complete
MANAPRIDYKSKHFTDSPVNEQGYTEFVEFRNVAPRSRQDRRNSMDKETLEKSRLAKRREGFHHYEDLGMVTVPTPDAVGYIDETERFQKDFAHHERDRRQMVYRQQEQLISNKKEKQTAKEEQRWGNIEDQFLQEEQKYERYRKEGKKAKRNAQSVPYNPITLGYHNSLGGEELRNQDEHIRYRAATRAAHLLERMSFTPYDPITGEDKAKKVMPAPPRNWNEIKSDYEWQQEQLEEEARRINAMMRER